MLKNSKLLKTTCALALVASLVIPTIAMADDTEPQTQPEPRHKMERKVDFKEKSDDLLGIVEEYSPETLSDWTSLVEEREGIHEEMKTVMDSLRELRGEEIGERRNARSMRKGEISEELKAKMDELRAKIENGEISKEELMTQRQEFAQTQRDSMKEEFEGFKAERKAKNEEWKLEHQEEFEAAKAKREEMKTLHGELKSAVEADDAETVKELLDQLFTEFEAHNAQLADRLVAMEQRCEEIKSEQE